MPVVLVAPERELAKVVRRGILTVPGEDALVRCLCPKPCAGMAKLPLQARKLERYALEMGARFTERMAVRGYGLIGELRLHGPWPSYELNRNLSDVNAENWEDMVFEQDAMSPYSDYLLVGEFLKQSVLTEVIVHA